MNTLIPFICLAFGAAVNWRGLPAKVLKFFDIATNAALILLMAVIGLNIGISPQVMDNLGTTRVQLPEIMEQIRKEVNKIVAPYEQISKIEIQPCEFEKTPKRSIKRFLYK